MGAVPVPAGLGRLAGVPGLGVHGRDHPVLGDLAGDPPPPVGPVGALGGLDVLPGDQRQQRQRGRGRLVQVRVRERGHQRVRVVHQRRDQRVLRRRVVPVDLRLARPGVVVPGAHRRDLLRRAGHLPGHPADRRDQLGDGVLGGHRIGQDRRVHRPAAPPLEHPGLLDHRPDRVVDPVRPRRLRDPLAPVHQRGRVEPRIIQRRADRRLPPHVEPDRLGGLPVRIVMQRLQGHHRGHLGRRDRRAAEARRSEQFLLLSLVAWFAFASLRYNWNWDAVSSYAGFFWRGWFTTIGVSAVALVLSTVLGVAVAMVRRSGFFVLRALGRIYVETLRGTPLLVQVSFGFYVVASAIHLENRLVVGVATLAICYGAFISEIVRGGIESIGASQLESARAIGLTRVQTYRYVIFPQAIRVILPGLAGMFASMIKDSSLLSVISIGEFTWSAQQVGGLTYSLFETYIPLAVGYLVLTLPITLWTQWLERRTKFET